VSPATVLAGVLLVAAVVVGGAGPVEALAIGTGAGALVAARRRVGRGARSVAALVVCFLVALWVLRAAGAGLWPLPLLGAAGLYALVSRAHGLELVTDWCVRGHGSRRGWALVGAVVPVSAAGLLAWFALAGHGADTQAAYRELLEGRGAGLLLAAGAGFALVNAAAEELVYNGITQRAFALDLRAAAAVLLTAAVFGASHWYGFPSGWAGVLLAAAYGLLLAAVRHVSGGLLLPWVAHVAADLTIVSILAISWSA
jgi:membrane protease YdiL (CAAX protease family)